MYSTTKRRQRGLKRSVVPSAVPKSHSQHAHPQQINAAPHPHQQNAIITHPQPHHPTSSSNPSKRHRERLNGELETVANLLPYDVHIIQRLDKLSILRLAVAFLQIKAHFNTTTRKCYPKPPPNGGFHMSFSFGRVAIPTVVDLSTRMAFIDPAETAFADIAQKSLNAFIMILKDDGDIFYVTENIETFLGYQQSDILHTPIFEMIHSEDREHTRAMLQQFTNAQQIKPCSMEFSEKFNVSVLIRFRCLLDNGSGFVNVEFRGRFISMYSAPVESSFLDAGCPRKFAMIALCTSNFSPFVTPMPNYLIVDDPILKSKHTLDLSVINMDSRLRHIFGIDDALSSSPLEKSTASTSSPSLYSLVHPDDVEPLMEAHSAVLKVQSSVLVAYRLANLKSGTIYYAQSSFKTNTKNGKIDSISATHRLLSEIDGKSLIEKRPTVKIHHCHSLDDVLFDASSSHFVSASYPQSYYTPNETKESTLPLSQKYHHSAREKHLRKSIFKRKTFPKIPRQNESSGKGKRKEKNGGTCLSVPTSLVDVPALNRSIKTATSFEHTPSGSAFQALTNHPQHSGGTLSDLQTADLLMSSAAAFFPFPSTAFQPTSCVLNDPPLPMLPLSLTLAPSGPVVDSSSMIGGTELLMNANNRCFTMIDGFHGEVSNLTNPQSHETDAPQHMVELSLNLGGNARPYEMLPYFQELAAAQNPDSFSTSSMLQKVSAAHQMGIYSSWISSQNNMLAAAAAVPLSYDQTQIIPKYLPNFHIEPAVDAFKSDGSFSFPMLPFSMRHHPSTFDANWNLLDSQEEDNNYRLPWFYPVRAAINSNNNQAATINKDQTQNLTVPLLENKIAAVNQQQNQCFEGKLFLANESLSLLTQLEQQQNAVAAAYNHQQQLQQEKGGIVVAAPDSNMQHHMQEHYAMESSSSFLEIPSCATNGDHLNLTSSNASRGEEFCNFFSEVAHPMC